MADHSSPFAGLFGAFTKPFVEQPPARYASGPTLSGHTTEVTYPSWEAVRAACANVNLRTTFDGHPMVRLLACYSPTSDTVKMPDRRLLPAKAWQDLDQHEWGHARGWRHNDDGTGTSPKSPPPANSKRVPDE